MAKAKISEWSATAGNNTEIDGVPLGEGVMTPSQVNNAIREVMSQVAELFGGTSGDAWPISAGGTGATSAAGARAALGIVDTSLSTATETTSGIMRISTAAEMTGGTLDNVALTPKKVTEWAPASATMDTVADEILIRDASDNKIKRATFPTVSSGLVFLSAQTASSSTSVDFTSGISSTYDEYVLSFEKVIPATNDVAFYLRVSTDGGSSYQTTSYLSSGVRWNTGGTGAEGRTDGISLSNASGGAGSLQSNTTANGGLSGTVRFWPNGAAGRKAFIGESGGISSSNGYFGFTVRGTWDGGNTAINAIRVLFSSGNITSGNFRLYGVAKS